MLTTNAGDTAWLLACSLLVFLMIPGFVFFYGGLLQKKNSLPFLLPCLMALCLISLQWVLFGYSLSFGPDHNGWIGNLAWTGLREVSADPNIEYAGTVPHLAFMMFHAMAALIAPVILLSISGERMKLRASCLFILLWTTCVYDPVAHWIWGVGGFLRSSGVLDFAGGSVIHLTAGVSAIAMAFVLGKSQDNVNPSRSPALALLGAGLLWVGWFGLTGGNALASGTLTAGAFAATQIAAAAGGLCWAMMDRVINEEINSLGLLTGAIAGLVAVTPAAGFIGIGAATVIGIGASLLCYATLIFMEKKFGFRDIHFSFVVHGVGAAWGMIAVGLWATRSVNPNGADGLFYGSPSQLLIQLKAIVAIALYSFGVTYLLLKMVDYLVGLRPRPSEH